MKEGSDASTAPGTERPEGTLDSIRARGDAGGFFRLAAPLLSRMVRRNIGKDLENLKRHLERQVVAAGAPR